MNTRPVKAENNDVTQLPQAKIKESAGTAAHCACERRVYFLLRVDVCEKKENSHEPAGRAKTEHSEVEARRQAACKLGMQAGQRERSDWTAPAGRGIRREGTEGKR